MKCIICGTQLKGKSPICPKCHFDMSEQLDPGKKDPYQLRTFDQDIYLDALQEKFGLKKPSVSSQTGNARQTDDRGRSTSHGQGTETGTRNGADSGGKNGSGTGTINGSGTGTVNASGTGTKNDFRTVSKNITGAGMSSGPAAGTKPSQGTSEDVPPEEAAAKQRMQRVREERARKRRRRLLGVLVLIALILAGIAFYDRQTGAISKLLSKNKTISGIASKTGLFPALQSEADSVSTQSNAGSADSQQDGVQIMPQETSAPQAAQETAAPQNTAAQETTAPQAVSVQEATAPQTAADDTGIHFYEMVVADVTWDQAFQDCIDRGGYLVRINTEEEFNYLTDLLEKGGHESIHFYIGGRRDSGGTEYRWVDSGNNFMGDVLNSSSSWTDGHWMANEPSFKDGDVQEDVLCLFKYEGAWRLNDVPNDTLATVSYYSGKIGYICEYE